MPYLHNYRLFISHAWRYSDGYRRVCQMLRDAPNFVWSNYSVPEDKAFERMIKADLQQQLRYQINPAQCVIILAGMYINHSDWIQFEINHAKAQGKPIVGIVPWGGQRVPIAVQDAADEIVAWQTSSLIAAIRRVTP